MNLFADGEAPLIDSIVRWPHQTEAVRRVVELVTEGCKRIVVQSPTGGGKSLIMTDVALWAIRTMDLGVNLFANRKLLVEQMVKNLKRYGVEYGVRAADHDTSVLEPFQVCSIQTEYSRVVKRKLWDTHMSGLIVVDEAHAMETNQANAVYKKYIERGAVKVGFSATPLGIDAGYDELVQAGTNSELRACGALVPAVHHGCTEPDMRHIRRYNVGEDLSEPDNVKAIMVPGIVGRVIDWYNRLNPHGLPSIGFAPGVPESVGFAEAFEEAGIPAAHIDGDKLWIRGEEYQSTEARRNELLDLSRTGEVRVVWNRFVLREAIDMPWLRHGIFATVFGSIQSYIQSGGRLLRASPATGKANVVVQDHGGNWWRHGSLNAERVWKLGLTNGMLAHERGDNITGDGPEGKKEQEPFICPRCQTVLVLRHLLEGSEVRCTGCGHVFDFRRRSRPVIQSDGVLVEHAGAIFRPKKVERRDDTQAKWKQFYWRAKNSSMTFSQAAGLFYTENGYYPPRDLPLMPRTSAEWYLQVKKVPFQRLFPEMRAEEAE